MSKCSEVTRLVTDWFVKVNKKESLNKSKLQAFDEHIGQSDVQHINVLTAK